MSTLPTHPLRNFLGLLFRTLFRALIGIFVFFILTVMILWISPTARRFAQSELLHLYLIKIAPQLPFTIEHAEVLGEWKEFRTGKFQTLSLDVLWQNWRIHTSGPLQVDWSKLNLKFHYLPLLSIHPLLDDSHKLPELNEAPIDLTAILNHTYTHFSELELSTRVSQWKWPAQELRLGEAALSVIWKDEKAHASLKIGEAESTHSVLERILKLKNISLNVNTPLTLQPFQLGPKIEFSLLGESGSTAWKKKKWALALAQIPLQGALTLDPKSSPNSTQTLDFTLGKPQNPELSFSGKLKNSASSPVQTLTLQWKTQTLALTQLLNAGAAFGQIGSLSYLKKVSGTVRTQGTAQLNLPLTAENFKQARVEAMLSLKKLSFEWPWKFLAVDGMNLELPISTEKGIHGSLLIHNLLFRRLKARLDRTEIAITPLHGSLQKFQVSIGGAPEGDRIPTIPLFVSERRIALGNLNGTLTLPKNSKSEFDYALATSLSLRKMEVTSLLSDACIKTTPLPSAQVSVNFSRIDLGPGMIDPVGEVLVNVFNGTIRANEIGFYELNREVPEIDFTVDVDQIDLSQLGNWLGFGEMDGILHTYAHDVVMQGSLPTQYEFLFETKPLHKRQIVFSPEAMKNLARLVAADAMNRLPGVAEWLTFGWPSRVLIGGFDIWLAGVSLYSHSGSIMLETLNPSWLPKNVADLQREQHFIVYGNRFRIPLNTLHYPVLVDAPAVSHYLTTVIQKLSGIKDKKTAKDQKNEKPQLDCEAPTLSPR